MRKVTRRLATVAAVIVVLTIPTIARAHGTVPFSNTNVIHACRSASGILRQITSGSCVGNEVAVHWDIGGQGGRADGPCADNANRYVDCGNGTVTDTVTGLIWLHDGDCLPLATYSDANQAAVGLKAGDCGLTDKSSPGDWRLPTMDEWRTTFAYAVTLGCTRAAGASPSLTNDAGTACLSEGPSSFTGVWETYWSSSSRLPDPSSAYVVVLAFGGFFDDLKVGSYHVWPVRGGPR